MNRTFKSQTRQLLDGDRSQGSDVDEILLASIEYVPILVLDGISIRLVTASFRAGMALKGDNSEDLVHDHLRFRFVLQGEYRFEIGKQLVILKAGKGIVIPPKRNYRWSCKREGIMFGANTSVSGQLAPHFIDSLERQSAGSFLGCSSAGLFAGLVRIVDLAVMPAPFHWRREMIASELHLWLARALHAALNLQSFKTPIPYQQKTQTNPSRHLCEEAVCFIRSNFKRSQGVFEAARYVGITPRHLDRLFHKYLHETPRAFLLRTRLEHADTLLKSSPVMRIKEIAFASGFRSPGHFTQCYKRYFGRLPTGGLANVSR